MGDMPQIIIDGETVECRERITILQAALEGGWDVPHYCYHPGLSIVASCRLCLMDMKMPHPQTREMGWAPKLFPACQTFVKDGMEVRFDSEGVRKNQAHVLERILLNHPLDCPVCDQAGECLLQDYSTKFGWAASRRVDPKQVNPKKDIGPHVLLYADRCVMCKRCVRFCREITGTDELGVINRGSRSEIDVFPGYPLDNPLSANVVDICPVGCLLDKNFLHGERVWFFQGTPSVCAGCSTGCSIRIDHYEGLVRRLKPRYNPDVNDWWICDAGRYGWKYVHSEDRLEEPAVAGDAGQSPVSWETALDTVRERLDAVIEEHGGQKAAVALSPFMSCEEAWMLASYVRDLAPDATLALNAVPTVGEDVKFPAGFTIRAEKCPNRRGVEMILKQFGGPQATIDELPDKLLAGDFQAVWLVGGYPEPWWSGELRAAVADRENGPELVIVQDILRSAMTDAATVVLSGAAWAEREGCFANADGYIQPFEWAVPPPEGARRDGQILWDLIGRVGMYNPDAIREEMAEKIEDLQFQVRVPPLQPLHQH